jgi:hypothetical protein
MVTLALPQRLKPRTLPKRSMAGLKVPPQQSASPQPLWVIMLRREGAAKT